MNSPHKFPSYFIIYCFATMLSLSLFNSGCTFAQIKIVPPFREGLGNSPEIEETWPPILRQDNIGHLKKLQLIREMSPSSNFVNDFTKQAANVCYTNECIDAAYSLLKSINFSVNPCDDFYQYSCGRWMTDNAIPNTFSSWGSFNVLVDKVNNLTQEILKSPNLAEDFKSVNETKEFFRSCTDLNALESMGISIILEILLPYGGWPSITPTWIENGCQVQWVQSLAESRRVFLAKIIVDGYVSLDLKDTNESVIYLDQPEFFIPRPILLNQVIYAQHINAAVQFYVDVAKEFLLLVNGSSITEAQLVADAREMIAFETALATIASADENRGNLTRVYNPKRLDEYQEQNGFGWQMYLDTLFESTGITINGDEKVIVLEETYFMELIPILSATSVKTLSNYFHWRLVSSLVGHTTKRMREIQFQYSHATTGLAKQLPREKVCASTVLDIFGMALGVKYVERAFDVSAKENVNEMVDNLRTAFKSLVDEADWLESITKQNAKIKADKMKQFMAFPDWLFNETRLGIEYAGAEITDGKFLESLVALRWWQGDKERKKLREVTDRDFWIMDPPTVNAGYSSERNSITFPAGILSPPFYRIKGPESLNYGGIGVVAGHEISHGFDYDGRQYDADGNAFDWWTANDLSNFVGRAKCIINQYDQYTVAGPDGQQTLHVNGNLTKGENIADNGGIHQSFRAYQTWIQNHNGGLPEKRLPGLEWLTPNQLFFLGFSKVWCQNIRPGKLIQQINTDPHSPARFRVIGSLQNSQDFADQWQCPVGSFMNPGKKCVLW